MARRAGCRLALTLAMAAVSLGSTASAATRTWTGGTSGMWSTAGNWSGGVAPLPGDDLVFPVVASNRAMTNDLVAASFATVAFTGDGYSLGGNLVELENLAFSSVTIGAALTLPIRLGSIATISTAGAPVKLSGALDLMGFGLTVLGDGRLTIEGIISGSGSLTRAGGTGILELSGANSYAGATKVSSGVLRIASPSALGDPTTGTTVDTTGSLQLMSPTPMSIAEPLVLSSQAFASVSALAGAHTWTGPITLQTDSTIATSTSLTLSGAISGAGKLRTLGDMTLEGTSSYAGGTEIQSHVVTVAGPSSLGLGLVKTWLGASLVVGNGTYPQPLAISGSTSPSGGLRTLPGSTTWSGPVDMLSPDSAFDVQGTLTVSGIIGGALGGGVTLRNTGTLRLTAANTYTGATSIETGTVMSIGGSAIPDGSLVRCDGRLTLEASETIGGLTTGTGPGVITIPAATTLGIATSTVNGWSGRFEGAGSLHVSGTGTQYLLGASTHTGGTHVESGTLLVAGSLTSGTTVATNAVFGVYQHGTVGTVTSSGGRVAVGPLGQRVGACSSLQLDATSTLDVTLDATTPDEFSQLTVTGPVVLAGAALNVNLGFAPKEGDSFEILRNDGSSAISGAFAGRPEGSVFSVGGVTFAITYAGGDGNDVVLSVKAPSPMDAGADAAPVDAGADAMAAPSDDGGAEPDSSVPSSDAGKALDGGAGTSPFDVTTTGADAGCGCRSATSGSAGLAPIALVVAASLGLRRRRGQRDA